MKMDIKTFVHAVASALGIPEEDYEVGTTMLFFRTGKGAFLRELEHANSEELVKLLGEKMIYWWAVTVVLPRWVRWYRARKFTPAQRNAVFIIIRFAKGLLARVRYKQSQMALDALGNDASAKLETLLATPKSHLDLKELADAIQAARVCRVTETEAFAAALDLVDRTTTERQAALSKLDELSNANLGTSTKSPKAPLATFVCCDCFRWLLSRFRRVLIAPRSGSGWGV